ncbi:hypothetical protein BH20ACI2_BH20ACI2_12940 [soil metagenome]
MKGKVGSIPNDPMLYAIISKKLSDEGVKKFARDL